MNKEIFSQKPWHLNGQEIKTIRTYKTSNTFNIMGHDEGGMGLVLFARREKDQRLYALKTPKGWEAETRRVISPVTHFRREALAWITLPRHRNIVQAFWFDLDEHYRPFLIMEYVEGNPRYGVSLRHWLKKEKRFELSVAIRFVLETLNGLVNAKKAINQDLGVSFIHRDIKPENLLLTSDGTLKVTDFGLVMGHGGTRTYMPPEQWEGKEVEEKTDIYALGCVLYEMVGKHRPFAGNENELRRQHLFEKPRPLETAPIHLNRLIIQCLDKSPDKRPDFSELMQSLQALYADLTGKPFQLKANPETLSAEDLNARGSGFDELGYYEKALECYNQAIALDSHDPRFYLNRATARLSLKDFEGALEDYRKALSLEPGEIEVFLGQGSLFAEKGDYERALASYLKGKEVAPEEPLTYVGLGNLYARQEHYRKAESQFRKALSLQRSLAEAYLGLGNVYLCQADYKKAEENYKQAIGLNPLYFHAYLNLAKLYHLMGYETLKEETIKTASLLMPLKGDNYVGI